MYPQEIRYLPLHIKINLCNQHLAVIPNFAEPVTVRSPKPFPPGGLAILEKLLKVRQFLGAP